MMEASIAVPIGDSEKPWVLPNRGIVGMWCLITAEAAIFLIFVVAYVYYLGTNLSGPTPSEVLEVPILGTICLLSSSLTVHAAVAALRKRNVGRCTLALALTIFLGTAFLLTTAKEWHHLIYDAGLTTRTNLFGTTYYSLVGLHATHVVVGLLLLSAAIVVFLVVYVLGR